MNIELCEKCVGYKIKQLSMSEIFMRPNIRKLYMRFDDSDDSQFAVVQVSSTSKTLVSPDIKELGPGQEFITSINDRKEIISVFNSLEIKKEQLCVRQFEYIVCCPYFVEHMMHDWNNNESGNL